MPKEGGNPAGGRRPSSRNAKPYDANNSFVRKVATKVTDFIPQSSWISKWFNTSQGNEDSLEGRGNIEETEFEDDIQQPPPTKRSRIRMDVIHPPGTFSIQTRVKTALNVVEPSKEQYPIHNEVTEDFLEPAIAGPSGIGRLISSTPATDIRTVTSHRSDLNSLASSTNNGIANGMDDNSESSESTSGCSSLIPQINRHEGPSNLLYNSTFNRKRHVDDKLTFTNHLQSPRSLFLDSNSRDTLSSRRPSFNASIITNSTDRASPLSSPFYSGNITFGGANAANLYKRSRNIFNNSNEIQLKVPRRTNVEVKPSDTGGVDSSGMSQTAKKILEALEHFSSPISDAKKIPLKNTNNTVSSVMSRKRAREEIANPSARIGLRHLTRELTVPTVPDILKLRRKQKLQDTTLMARKIVSARSNPPPSPQEYQLRTEDTNREKYRGKLKGKSKVNLEQEKTVAPVNLPNIPLPITTLPNFNFTLPSPALYSAGKTVANKENAFTFASPIKVTHAEKSLQSVNNFTFSNPINAEDSVNSTTDLNSHSTTENKFTVDCAITSIPNFVWSGSSTAPRLKTKVKNSKDDSVESAISQERKSESVTDVLFLKSDKIKSNLIGQSNLGSEMTQIKKTNTFNLESDITNTHNTESSWECSECMIRNNGTDKQCTACKISRPNPNEKISLPSTSTDTTVVETKPVVHDCFGSQFKLSMNQWECATCCVRNKQSDATCVACTAPKSGNTSTMQQTVKSQNFDLMEKFKPTEGSWECSGCLLRNAANIITCPCCNTSKPVTSIKTKPKTDVTELSVQKLNTNIEVTTTQEISNTEIMNKFKPNKDSWECSGCLVRNNNSVTICPCCSTSKPNSTNGSNKTEQTSNNGFGDKFKKPEGAWICDSCLVQNDAKQTECVACQTLKPGTIKSNESSSNAGSTLQFKFGVLSSTTNSTNQSGGFKFGLDKADDQSKSDISLLNGFKFGNAQQNSGMAQFTFGIPKEENKAVSEVSKTNSVTTSSNTGFIFNVKTPEKSESTKQEMLFGVPKSDNLTTANEKQNTSVTSNAPSTTPLFSFGVLKPKLNESPNKEAQKTSFATTVTENSQPVATTDTVSFNVKSPEKPESANQNQETKQEILFGMLKSDSLTSEKQNTNVSSTPSTTSIFSFGAPKPEFNQSASNKETQKTSFATTVTESSKQVATSDAESFNIKSSEKSKSTNQTQETKQEILFDMPKNDSFTTASEKQNTSIMSSSALSTAPLFPFGVLKPKFNQSSSNKEAQKTSFATTVTESSKPIPTIDATSINTTTLPSLLTQKNITKNILNAKSEPIFSFTVPSSISATTSATTSVTSTNATTTCLPTFAQPTFTFSDSKTPSHSSGFAMPDNKIPTFSSNTDNKPPIFGTSETKLPVFNSPPVTNPLSTFDTLSNNTTSSPFGSSNASTFGNNSTPAFGSTTTTPTIFSTTKPNEANASNSSLFTFGSTSSQQSASGGFNFSANPTVSSAKPLFTFGSNSNTPQNSNNTFGSGTFGANSAPTNTANFTFNPPKQETPAAFGQGAVTTPIFGTQQANPQTQATSSFSSTPSSSTGFNFGSTAPVAATSGGFNFGGMSSTSASTGGFNFNSPASTPAFDPNSRPSFNFTKGSAPAMFNATPQSAPAPRKIKKAFRRCMR